MSPAGHTPLSTLKSKDEFSFSNPALYYSIDIINYDHTWQQWADSQCDTNDLNDAITAVCYLQQLVWQYLFNLLIAWLTVLSHLAKFKSLGNRLLKFTLSTCSTITIYSVTFQFLRYFSPRRLRRLSRRVLLDNDEYQITHVGRGAFATVSRVLHKPSGDLRVMKRIVFDKTGLAQSLAQAEVGSLKAVMGCMWFPQLLNHFMDEDEYIITMPFYHRGDMSELIKHKGYLGSELAKFYCAELTLAIQYLHRQGIIHRDIKPDNIFLDETGHLILADFGLAEYIAIGDPQAHQSEDGPLLWVDTANPSLIKGTSGAAGTFWYTAPEVFRNEKYSFGVDYYSVGVIYYELVTGQIPFNNFIPYPEDKRPKVYFGWKPGQVKGIGESEKQAILEILAPNPRDRPQTVTHFKQSLVFNGVDWEKMSLRGVPPPPLPLPLLEG